MLMSEPAQFIKIFVADLDIALSEFKANAKLTQTQKFWLGFCLTAILLTNTVCWAKFERASLGEYKIAALSWMFREAKIAWSYLLFASVKLILKRHGITEGELDIDEPDDLEALGDLLGVAFDALDELGAERVGRQDAG